MMIDCVASPRKAEATAVTASRISTALLSCRLSTAQALTRCVRMMFGPCWASRADASADDRPSDCVCSVDISSDNGADAAWPAVTVSMLPPQFVASG